MRAKRIKKYIPKPIKRWRKSILAKLRNYELRRKRPLRANSLIKTLGLTYDSSKSSVQHVLILVIDCLRQDHLSPFGYQRKVSPFLDSLASRAAVFADAVSASSWTYPSVASILSGKYPHNHGGIYTENMRNLDEEMLPRQISDNVLILPEILARFGFKNYFASAIEPAKLPIYGRFREISICHLCSAERIMDEYLSWLRGSRIEKTFSYVQIGDLHEPIQIPAAYLSVFGTIPDIPHVKDWHYVEGASSGDADFERYRRNRIKLYDCAIRYVDDQIKQLFSSLEDRHLLNSVLIILTADHGEEMWDHLEMERQHFYDPRPAYGVGHGHHLFQEVVKVPLFLYGRGISPGFIKHRVSTVDIVPTLFDVLGIRNYGKLNLDGINLFHNVENRVILSEDVSFGYEKKAVFLNQYKLYFSKGDKVSWLFDLEKDPGENSPLDNPEVKRKLLRYLPMKEKQGSERIQIDKDTRDRLRDLGYID